MSIAFDGIEQIGGTRWRYTWTATTSPYRVYYRGELRETVTDTEYTIAASDASSEPPVIEVLDASDTDPPEMLKYPPRLALQWRGVEGAAAYLLYRYEDTAWVHRATVLESGRGYYEHVTDVVDDLSIADWAVYAVSAKDNSSYPVEVSGRIVRNPDPPEVTMTYDKPNSEIDIVVA